MQRDLVQWNLTAVGHHNQHTNGDYLRPLLALESTTKSWSTMTAGMSAEELADME